MRNKQFFTIIELIVVVAILAVLASMLMPALKRSAEQGQLLMCQNVMRTYHTADDLYAEDHNEYYVVIRSDPWRYTWFRNESYLSYFNTSTNDIRRDSALQCPKLSSPSYLGFSYAPNWRNDTFWWSDFANKSLIRNRIQHPSKKVKLIENTDWHASTWQCDPQRWLDYGETASNTVTYRHFNGCNIDFADGHIEYRTPESVYFGGDGAKINDLWTYTGDSFNL